MRNFRTAAVAAATAVSVAFAGTSVAFAAEGENEDNLSSVISSAGDKVKENNDEDATLSSKWGKALGVEEQPTVTGADNFGKETDPNRAPWAKVATAGLYTAIGTAVASALVAAYNFAVYNNIVPGHVLDPIFR